MIIKESDFELKQVSDASPHWDLSLVRIINANSKTREAREELKVEGYGYTLSGALATIARYRVSRDNEGAMTMQQYLDSYTNELRRLYNIVGEIPNNPTLLE